MEVPGKEHKNCVKCGLWQTCKAPFFAGTWPNTPPADATVFITDAPGEVDERKFALLSGRNGVRLSKLLTDAGMDPTTAAFESAVRCRPPDGAKPGMKHIKWCRPFLMAALNEAKPKQIVALGDVASRSLLCDGRSTLKRDRGRTVPVPGLEYTPNAVRVTYSPAALAYSNPVIEKALASDLKAVVNGQTVEPGDYTILNGLSDILSLAEKWRDGTAFSVDLEWSVETGQILSCAVSLNPKEAFVFMVEHETAPWTPGEIYDALSRLLSGTSRKIGHNISEDYRKARSRGIDFQGPIYDTLVLAKMINENYTNYTLEHFAIFFANMPDYAAPMQPWKKAKKDFLTVPPDTLMFYNAGDADASTRLLLKWKPKCEKQPWWPLYLMYMDAEVVLNRSALNGFQTDADVLAAKQAEFTAQATETKTAFLAGLKTNKLWRPRWGEFKFEKGGICPDDESVRTLVFKGLKLKPVAFTKKTQLPSVDKKSLAPLSVLDTTGTIKQVLALRKVSKLISTYITGLGKRIVDGKFQPGYTIAGAKTKRLASRPNIQNIPKIIREAFISRYEGGLVMQFDHDQLEPRVMAHMANETRLIQAFIDRVDVYSLVGSDVFGVPWSEFEALAAKYGTDSDEYKDFPARKNAKPVLLGMNYGLTKYGLSARLNCGVEEADDIIRRYLKQYSGIKTYMDERRAELVAHKRSTSMFGNVRHLDYKANDKWAFRRALRQAVNFPIQNSASDITLSGMIGIEGELYLTGTPISLMVAEVHDALVYDVPGQEADHIEERVIWHMTHPTLLDTYGITLRTPLRVSSKRGSNWKNA